MTGWGLAVTIDIVICVSVCLSVCPSLRNPSGLNPDIRQYPQAQNGTDVYALGTQHKTAGMKEQQFAFSEFADHTPEYANILKVVVAFGV